MTYTPLPLIGAFRMHNFSASDQRGSFTKTFHRPTFEALGLGCDFRECYYSLSRQHVIRGMHFQTPPHDHYKLVYVTVGHILDVILDLRKESSTYGQAAALELRANGDSVYLPAGLAHGFLTLSKEATVMYHVSTPYAPVNDAGIHYDSFGFDWPERERVILSDRDRAFSGLNDFNSPF